MFNAAFLFYAVRQANAQHPGKPFGTASDVASKIALQSIGIPNIAADAIKVCRQLDPRTKIRVNGFTIS
jgi:hypothetical protein